MQATSEFGRCAAVWEAPSPIRRRQPFFAVSTSDRYDWVRVDRRTIKPDSQTATIGIVERPWFEMEDLIRYRSTNRSTPSVDLRQAVLAGLAPDRGLFVPERIPSFTRLELADLTNQTYQEVAFAVLSKFTAGVFDGPALLTLCREVYNFDVPLEEVTHRRHIMRLDRGPTASFKDFAARMMARWMGLFMGDQDGELIILTATSGDTGSAVAHAYHGVDRIRVVVLFPTDEVSDRQRKQMTTLGDNVTVLGVDGKFDDCQDMVKRAFADPMLSGIHLTSANSINIARLLPQSVYYVYAYARLAEVSKGEPIIFSVPSGNFGNMMGAMIAKRMGVPIEKIIVATNANDEVPEFLRTGSYEKVAPSRVCISNAMNVGHPSNLARLIDLYGGWMDHAGVLREAPDLDKLRRDVHAVSIDDKTTRATLRDVHKRFNMILEPHGAVGWAGLERFLCDHPSHADTLTVSIETAHPAKFPEEIRTVLGVDPDPPPSLIGLDDRPEQYETIPAEYESFREFLKSRY